jgi:hypothetical protein
MGGRSLRYLAIWNTRINKYFIFFSFGGVGVVVLEPFSAGRVGGDGGVIRGGVEGCRR